MDGFKLERKDKLKADKVIKELKNKLQIAQVDLEEGQVSGTVHNGDPKPKEIPKYVYVIGVAAVGLACLGLIYRGNK